MEGKGFDFLKEKNANWFQEQQQLQQQLPIYFLLDEKVTLEKSWTVNFEVEK